MPFLCLCCCKQNKILQREREEEKRGRKKSKTITLNLLTKKPNLFNYMFSSLSTRIIIFLLFTNLFLWSCLCNHVSIFCHILLCYVLFISHPDNWMMRPPQTGPLGTGGGWGAWGAGSGTAWSQRTWSQLSPSPNRKMLLRPSWTDPSSRGGAVLKEIWPPTDQPGGGLKQVRAKRTRKRAENSMAVRHMATASPS